MQKRYRVVLNGIHSTIIPSKDGEYTTLREAKEELVNYLSLQIKAYVNRLSFVTTGSLPDYPPTKEGKEDGPTRTEKYEKKFQDMFDNTWCIADYNAVPAFIRKVAEMFASQEFDHQNQEKLIKEFLTGQGVYVQSKE